MAKSKFYRVIERKLPQTPFTEMRIGQWSASTGARPFVRDGLLSVLASSSGVLKFLLNGQAADVTTPLILSGSHVRLSLNGRNLWIGSTYGPGPYSIAQTELDAQWPPNIRTIRQVSFGQSSSWFGDFIVSRENGLIAAFSDNAANRLTFRVFKGDEWEDTQLPNGMGNSSFLVSCEHPADGSIWFFGLRDGEHWFRVIRAHFDGGHFVVDFDRMDMIQQDGEMSAIRVTPDPIGKQLIVSRTIKPAVFYSTTPFRKGCPIGLAFINADASFTEIRWPDGEDTSGLCEAVSPHGVALDNDTLWLGSHQYNPNTGRFDYATVRRLNPDDGKWECPILLAKSEPALGYRGGAWDQFLAAESTSLGPALWYDKLSGTDCRIWRQTETEAKPKPPAPPLPPFQANETDK